MNDFRLAKVSDIRAAIPKSAEDKTCPCLRFMRFMDEFYCNPPDHNMQITVYKKIPFKRGCYTRQIKL